MFSEFRRFLPGLPVVPVLLWFCSKFFGQCPRGAWESFCFSEVGCSKTGRCFQAGSEKWKLFVNQVVGAPLSFAVKLFHGWALKCFLSVRLFLGHRAGTVCLLREV